MRWMLAAVSGLVGGALCWSVVGYLAAEILTRAYGAQEGANAMGGFFFVGGLAGVLGLVLSAWLGWRASGSEARRAAVGWTVAASTVLLVGGWTYALQPTYDPGIRWPDGQHGEVQVEVKAPVEASAPAPPKDLRLDLRCGDYTLTAEVSPNQVRREGDHWVVPGAFTMRDRQLGFIFAVMRGDRQVAAADLDLREGALTADTEWSDWQAAPEGLAFRFRTAVLPNR
jgi:MFS family permease